MKKHPFDALIILINMSITASLAGLLILVLRKIRKIPRSLIAFLWLIPVIRLICPVSARSRFSFYTPYFVSLYDLTKNVKTLNPDVSFQNFIMLQSDQQRFSHVLKSEAALKLLNIFSYIWFITALILIISLIASYHSAVRSLKDARQISPGVYISSSTLSPVLKGIINPKIILPHIYSEKSLEYILMHEKMHIKRQDNLKRIVLLVLSCIYWFNPLILMMIRKSLSDIEFACDEAVLKKCGEDKKREYASVIADAAESRNMMLSSFGGSRTGKRIKFILSYKKISRISLIFFLILTFFFAFSLLTNAAVKERYFPF